MRTRTCWGWHLRAAQNPWKQTLAGSASDQGTQLRATVLPTPPVPSSPGPRASCLCHSTCTRPQLFSLKFQFPLLFPPQLQEPLLAVLAHWTGPGRTCTCPGGEGEQGEWQHLQSTININITNNISGSSCSFTHATNLSFLKIFSVHLFCFSGTCLCLVLPFFLFAEVYTCFSSEAYKRLHIWVMY